MQYKNTLVKRYVISLIWRMLVRNTDKYKEKFVGINIGREKIELKSIYEEYLYILTLLYYILSILTLLYIYTKHYNLIAATHQVW